MTSAIAEVIFENRCKLNHMIKKVNKRIFNLVEIFPAVNLSGTIK